MYHNSTGMEVRDNFQEMALSFQYAGSMDLTQVVGHGGKYHYPLSSPKASFSFLSFGSRHTDLLDAP